MPGAFVPFPKDPIPVFKPGLPVPADPLPPGSNRPGSPPPIAPAVAPPPTRPPDGPPPIAALPAPAAPTPPPSIAPPRPLSPANANPVGSAVRSRANAKPLGLQTAITRSFSNHTQRELPRFHQVPRIAAGHDHEWALAAGHIDAGPCSLRRSEAVHHYREAIQACS